MSIALGLSIAVSGAFGTVQVSELPAPTPVVKSTLSPKAAARAAMASAVMATAPDPYVRERVAEYFSDIPVMVRIAQCESKFHQHDLNGATLVSVTNDLGVMQINSLAHAKTALELGYDLHDLEENMAYARMLYNRSGTTPWNSSAKCWAPGRSVATGPSADLALRKQAAQE